MRALFQSFLRNHDGQFALMMSILSLPLLAGVGLAIDYSYAVQSRNRLRAANDAAAFFAATEYKNVGTLPSQERVLSYLTANFNKAVGEVDPAVKEMSIKDMVLTLDSQVNAPVFIMGIFGQDMIEINATSSITVGQETQLEIALALDTTYSMTKTAGVTARQLDPNDNTLPPPAPNEPELRRIDALKVAALKFNNAILNTAGVKERARIAVVPFARYVNVGLANRNAQWMSVPDDSGPTGQQCYQYYEITGYKPCVEYTWYYDGVPVKGQWCEPVYGTTQKEECYPTGASVWSGCVGSRTEPDNLLDPYAGKKFPGLMNTWCNTEILPLTDDAVKVGNHISSLYANDFTYIPEGIMWGARMLSKDTPFTEAKGGGTLKEVKKILVLMTDGENQAMADLPAAPTHHVLTPDMDAQLVSSDVDKANVWTRQACEAAKADSVEIYAISFGTDLSGAAKQVLEKCATDASHYYDASNAAKLVGAFEQIAYRVSATYLSN